MPLYEFRCEDGHVTERVTARLVVGRLCPCGKMARRILSTFSIKQYQVDRSNFALVAPRGADGKPMTLTEAQRSGAYDRYSGAEEARERAAAKAESERAQGALLEQSRREAWRETRAKWKVTV